MIDYRVDLAARGTSGLGAVIIEDVLGTVGVLEVAPRLMFTDVLNTWGVCEFTLPIDHASVTRANFALANREVHVYRNSVFVWGGKLLHAGVDEWGVRFRAHSWYWDLAAKREVEDDYASQPVGTKDQFDIVRELVDLTQAEVGGGLGITHFDLLDSGVARRLIVCAEERRKVGDVIEELAGATTGFDFNISPAKVLRLYYPRRGVTVPVVTLNAATNVSDFSYDEDATDLNTQMAGVGGQEDCTVPTIYVTTDAGALATYGLLQDHINPEDRKDDTWLEASTDEALRISKVTRLQPRVALPTDLQEVVVDGVAYGAVEVGDEVTMQASRGAVGGFGRFNQDFRVLSRTVEVARPGIEKITFGLDQVIV